MVKKRESPQKAAHTSDEYTPLLEVLYEAMMDADVEKAFAEVKSGDGDAHTVKKLCQRAIESALTGIAGEHLQAFVDGKNEITSSIAMLNALLRQQGEQLAAVRNALTREDVIKRISPHAKFLDRLDNDHPHEKRLIAEEAAKNYFRDEQLCCFIQASSLAIELGYQIGTHGISGVLIHTNSVAFPLTVLQADRGIGVYAFSGPEYDPICGGWLFSARDPLPRLALEGLFSRPERPLDTVFITPFFVSSADRQIHFELSQANFLASLLIGHAKRIILLVTGDRVVDVLPQARSRVVSTQLPDASAEKRIEIVACGQPSAGVSVEDAAMPLVSRGITIHWRLTDEYEWTRFHPD